MKPNEVKAKYEEVVIIEDTHQLLGKTIKIQEGHLFVGPLNIQEAEDWEKRLNRIKEPYVLAQAETTIPMKHVTKENPSFSDLRLTRGYFLFVQKSKKR